MLTSPTVHSVFVCSVHEVSRPKWRLSGRPRSVLARRATRSTAKMFCTPSPSMVSRAQSWLSAPDCSSAKHSKNAQSRCIRVPSSRDSSGHSSDSFSMPERLHSTESFRAQCREGEKPSNATVYTVRLETGTGRRAGMDDLNSGVQLCLMGKTDALLHRVGQLKEDNRTEDVMAEICEIVGPEAGAACSPGSRLGERVERGVYKSEPGSKYTQRRFQSGSIDEVCFVGPDIGPLKAVIVGPEEGAWKLDEVVVSSSAGAHTQRFMCQEHLGQKSGKGAVVLKVVPDGKVVYGSGDRATLISVREAENLKAENLSQYAALKRRILTFTGAIISSGLVIAGLTGGSEAAQAFALGGILAVAYQLALNRSVDAIPLGVPGITSLLAVEAGLQPAAADRDTVMSAGGNNWSNFTRRVNTGGVQRQALVGALVLGALYCTQLREDANGSDDEVHQLSILITAMLGFASYKVAVVAAALSPAPVGVTNDVPAKKQ